MIEDYRAEYYDTRAEYEYDDEPRVCYGCNEEIPYGEEIHFNGRAYCYDCFMRVARNTFTFANAYDCNEEGFINFVLSDAEKVKAMKDYIERVCDEEDIVGQYAYEYGLESWGEDAQHYANVRQNLRGAWIPQYVKPEHRQTFKCSNCNQQNIWGAVPYCPWCGCKMDAKTVQRHDPGEGASCLSVKMDGKEGKNK